VEEYSVCQSTAIDAINAQIELLHNKATMLSDQFFDSRGRINKNKQAKRHNIQPRIVDTGGSFSLIWIKYIPQKKELAKTPLKTSHISKGKTHRFMYSQGFLKKASVSDLEFEQVWTTEARFAEIRKSLFYLVEARKSLKKHQKNLEDMVF
jgi:hypothetical protein